ncbi:MAG TPA: hypothetical protein VKE22_19870 [Haliangiales bacterium]|nr:hypothetical protein [Haliangiales bacterium]
MTVLVAGATGAVGREDCIAPPRGKRRLEEYFVDYCGGARRK